jgi:hypothetical protein
MSNKKLVPTEPHHIKLIDALIANGGNITAAAEAAEMGRPNAGNVVQRYKDYILDKVEGELLLTSIKAARVMGDTLTDDGSTPGGKLRLDAAQQVLDRIGVSKRERVDIKVEATNGLFILPRKDIEDANTET